LTSPEKSTKKKKSDTRALLKLSRGGEKKAEFNPGREREGEGPLPDLSQAKKRKIKKSNLVLKGGVK